MRQLTPVLTAVLVLGFVEASWSAEFPPTGQALGSAANQALIQSRSKQEEAASTDQQRSALGMLSSAAPGGLNLLFYGNSYSQFNSGMPSLAGFIAEEAGQISPNIFAQLAGGQNLFYHLTNPGQAAAISNSLPVGEQWDYVIMQGQSLEATSQFGNPTAFRANALAIASNVRAHSPGAKTVMYQTWARAAGFGGYPGSYANPLAMHAEIRANYQLAVDDINAAFGTGSAFTARAGDAVALLAFDASLYTADQSHPTPPTTLMAAMGVYQAIYRQGVCDLMPDFGSTSNLVNRLTSQGLSSNDWTVYGGIAERVADVDVRRWPGSSDDLLLSTGINGGRNSCPLKSAESQDLIAAVLTSPNATFLGMPGYLILDPFPTGNTPGLSDPWPELHFHLPSSFIVKQTQALGSTLTYQATVPGSFPGLSLLIQGLAFAPSAETGNPVFTTTDAHEFVLQ